MNQPGAAGGHLRNRTIGFFLWSLFTWFAFVPSALWANPTGGTVVSGTASMSTSGTTLNVVNSNGAIIDWQTFSIRSGETTNFLQPSATSTVLNEVLGNNPSAIYGTLSSNGRVMLINPNGILVGSSGVINTAGFTASTLSVDNSQFTSGGGLQLTGTSGRKVVNLGQINATDGNIYLIAEHVTNKGSLTAANGNVGLYASNQVYLTTGANGAGAVRVAATGTGPAAGTGIVNSGTIQAVQVELKATGNLYALAINNTGAIRATGATVKNGVIHLTALGGTVENSGTLAAKNADGSGGTVKMTTGAGGTTLDTGTIDVSSQTAGKTGGLAELTGDDVAVYDNALINASGPAGGGTILIGGDLHGANAAVYDATSTYIGEDAVLRADATDSGNGGKVVVWSNDATRFYGTISAQGGPNGGNGGQVETSGGYLEAFGTVTTAAPKGLLGSWLLDPDDLTIVNYPDDAFANSAGLSGAPDFSLASGSGPSVLTDYSVTQALADNDVTIQADGSITIQADTNLSWSSSHGLTMTAGTDITVDAAVTASGGGAITMTAGGNIDVNAVVSSAGGAITLRADSQGTGVGTVAVANASDLSTSGALTIFYNPTSYATPTSYTNANVDGTLTAFMLVNTIAQLQEVATTVNDGSTGGDYALGKSIDASSVSNFTPIGTSQGTPFTGIFDGQGYAISGLTIDAPSSSFLGLFGANAGMIENLGLNDVSIIGDSYVGGLVGWNNGLIGYSYATGTVAGNGIEVGGLAGYNGAATITHSYAAVAVSGPDAVGGLVGHNNTGTIEYSYALGTVTAVGDTDNSQVGGLVGQNDTGTIIYSYAAGAATGSGNVGGLVGEDIGGTYDANYWNNDASGTEAAYGIGSSSSDTGAQGLSTEQMMTPSSYTNWTNAVNIDGTGTWYIAGTSDTGTAGSTYPILVSEYSTTISNGHQLELIGMNPTTLGATYTLANNIDLTATGNGGDVWGVSGSTFAPIAANSAFTGTFNGNGYTINGLTVNASPGIDYGLFGQSSGMIEDVNLTNVSVTGGLDVGALVGYNTGTVEGSSSTGTVSSGATALDIGGLVGENGGTIDSSHSSATIYSSASIQLSPAGGLVGNNDVGGTITDSYATGNIVSTAQNDEVGGFAGYNQGTITNSYATGNITFTGTDDYVGGFVGGNDYQATISGSYATGSITDLGSAPGGGNVGGFIGYNNGTISTSYATGNITFTGTEDYVGGFVGYNDYQAAISGSYATGSVIAASPSASGGQVGGFAGYNDNTISDSYATGAVSGLGSVGGFVGYNDSSGTISDSYAGGAVTSLETDGQGDFGGFVGFNNGSVSAAYAYGAVSGGNNEAGGFVGSNAYTITDVYASGAVTGTAAGGFGGTNIGAVSGSFWDTQTSGQANAYSDASSTNGVTGITTAQAMSAGTYTSADWNIGTDQVNDTWVILDGQTRPMLAMEYNTTIVNAHQLQLVGLNATTLGVTYVLGANIDATGTTNASDVWGGITPGTGFAPIGSTSSGSVTPFTGSLNGQGYTIDGLTINSPASYVGLFADLEGSVSNLGLINLDIVSTGAGNVYAGGIAGVSGDNNGGDALGTISNVYVSGSVVGNSYIGGFVGWNDDGGTISNSYSQANVDSANGSAGGFIGLDYGSNNGPMSDDYASGSVTGNQAGGLVGALDQGTISNSNFWITSINANGVGLNSGTFQAQGITTAQSMQASTYQAAGWNIGTSLGNTWVILNGSTRPMLSMEYSTTISNAHQLQLIGLNSTTLAANYTLAHNLNLSSITNASDVWGTSVTGGIVTGAGFAPIGAGSSFTGTFNGNGYTLGGLTINAGSGSSDVGLFSQVGSGGTVENLNLTGVDVSGGSYLGGLVGVNDGTLSDVSVAGTVSGTDGSQYVAGLAGQNGGTITLGSNAANVTAGTGAYSIGGITGYNSGTISESDNTGAIITGSGGNSIGGLVGHNLGSISQSFNGGLVMVNGEGNQVGGLVGYNFGAITDSYSIAEVSGGADGTEIGGLVGRNDSEGTLTNTYASGFVIGAVGSIGGLVGNNLGTMTGSFWDIETSGLASAVGEGSSAGATGETTAALQSASTTSSWSGCTWGIADGSSYPYLQWQFPNGVQVISGTAYSDPVSSIAWSGEEIGLAVNGTALGNVESGANGYFYLAVGAGTVADNDGVLAYAHPGAPADTASGLANTVFVAGGETVTSLTLTADMLTVGADSSSNYSLGISTSEIPTLISNAVGTLADSAIIPSGTYSYNADTGAFTLSAANLGLANMTGESVLTLNGDVTVTGALVLNNISWEGGDSSLTLTAAHGISIDEGTLDASGPISLYSGSGSIGLTDVTIGGWEQDGPYWTPDTSVGALTLSGGTVDAPTAAAGGSGIQDDGIYISGSNIYATSITAAGQSDGAYNSAGIALNASSLLTNGGTIQLTGTDAAVSGATNRYGVEIENGSEVNTAGTGSIVINGTSGTSTASGLSDDYGVWITGSSQVYTTGGNLSITGISWSSSSGSSNNVGVLIDSENAIEDDGQLIATKVSTGGSGSLTINGYAFATAAGSGGTSQEGFVLDGYVASEGSSVGAVATTVETQDGALSITGFSGAPTISGGNVALGSNNLPTGTFTAAGTNSSGIVIENGAQVNSVGAGNITLTGQTGAGTDNYGIDFDINLAAAIQSTDGSTKTYYGSAVPTVNAEGTGSIIVNADSIGYPDDNNFASDTVYDGSSDLFTGSGNGGNLTIEPLTGSTEMYLGGTTLPASYYYQSLVVQNEGSGFALETLGNPDGADTGAVYITPNDGTLDHPVEIYGGNVTLENSFTIETGASAYIHANGNVTEANGAVISEADGTSDLALWATGSIGTSGNPFQVGGISNLEIVADGADIESVGNSVFSLGSGFAVSGVEDVGVGTGITMTGGSLEITAMGTGGLNIDNHITMNTGGGQIVLDGGAGTGSEASGAGSFTLADGGVISAGTDNVTIKGSGEINLQEGSFISGTGTLTFATSSASASHDFTLLDATTTSTPYGAYLTDSDTDANGDLSYVGNTFTSISFAAATGGDIYILDSHSTAGLSALTQTTTPAYIFQGTNVYLGLDAGQVTAALPSGSGTAVTASLDMPGSGANTYLVASNNVVLANGSSVTAATNDNRIVMSGENLINNGVTLTGTYDIYAAGGPSGSTLGSLSPLVASGSYGGNSSSELPVSVQSTVFYPGKTTTTPTPIQAATQAIITSTGSSSVSQASSTIQTETTEAATTTTTTTTGDTTSSSSSSTDTGTGTTTGSGSTKKSAIIPPAPASSGSTGTTPETVVGAGASGAIGHGGFTPNIPPPPSLGSALTPAVRNQLQNALAP